MNNLKGYKGFGPGLVCQPDATHKKQYAENTDFEEHGGDICGEGMMHYCTRPLDVLEHYPMYKDGEFSEYAEVEALETPVTDDNRKYATKKLHIGTKISFGDLVKASVEYDLVKTKGNSQTGYRSGNSQTGYCSGNSQTGNRSGNSQTGDYSGNSQTGHFSGNSQTGDCSRSKQIGAFSGSISTGDYCWHDAAGKQCIAVGWGRKNKAKGSVGSYIVLAEWGSDEIINAKMVMIDGEIIKADTWYMLKNGEFVECQEVD